MKKTVYLLALVLICIACKTKKNPENDYQACIAAESAYNTLGSRFELESKSGKLTEEERSGFEKELDALFENTKTVFAYFYKNNINTAFGQNIFTESRWTRRLNEDQLASVVEAVTDEAFKETDAYKNAEERLFRMKNTRPGNPYTNIIAKDPKGNTVELANYTGKGKYVLLNFWASWCPDCRKEMPALKKLYAAHKGKNFEIVGYSLDRTHEEWIKGIETLNIPWYQLSDCDYWNSQGAKLYAVQYIPLFILISPEGNIIERGIDVNVLKEKLSYLLK